MMCSISLCCHYNQAQLLVTEVRYDELFVLLAVRIHLLFGWKVI